MENHLAGSDNSKQKVEIGSGWTENQRIGPESQKRGGKPNETDIDRSEAGAGERGNVMRIY